MKIAASIGLMAAVAGGAMAQSLTIDMVPATTTVDNGESFRIDVYASWDGVDAGPNGSALAGFGFVAGAIGGASGVASASFDAADLNPDLALGSGSSISGDRVEVFGGQVPNLNGTFNPGVVLSNPIFLFSFDVQTASDYLGTITYNIVGETSVNSAVAIYPDSQDASLLRFALRDATVNRAVVEVIPAPGAVAFVGLAGLAGTRRRR